MNSTFYVFLTLCFAYCYADVYTDCGSSLAKIENVIISGCDDTQEECILKRNSNVSISFDLTPSVPLEKINTVVHGIMAGLPIPFPLPQPDACKGSGLTCPLKENVKYSYIANLPVRKTYPKITLEVKWELQNTEKKSIICLLIPATIR